ncbi:MAG: imidazoleglycerol-phosphate dehydratase HisB [Clostridiales bacterium]|nr:imidazoleglycerol-phosphate dehydratase HisB [Clostridiales bacterium]
MRSAEIKRATSETQIELRLNLDGTGAGKIATGVGFMDHMLTLFARHARMDLDVVCKGDTWVDDHHSVEDIGICLGAAIAKAVGDKRGIRRYGSMLLPMDEALVLCALDLSGRSCLRYQAQIPSQKIGTFDTELVEEFFLGLTRAAGMTLHMRMMDGTNSHHIVEAMFKALGRALREAVAIDESLGGEIPSTKGVLV